MFRYILRSHFFSFSSSFHRSNQPRKTSRLYKKSIYTCFLSSDNVRDWKKKRPKKYFTSETLLVDAGFIMYHRPQKKSHPDLFSSIWMAPARLFSDDHNEQEIFTSTYVPFCFVRPCFILVKCCFFSISIGKLTLTFSFEFGRSVLTSSDIRRYTKVESYT